MAEASLLALIDTYAAARAERDAAHHHLAGWASDDPRRRMTVRAFDDAHRRMTAARAAIAAVLELPIVPPRRDPISAAAAAGIARAGAA